METELDFDSLTMDDIIISAFGGEWAIIEKDGGSLTVANIGGSLEVSYSREEVDEMFRDKVITIKKRKMIEPSNELGPIDPSNKPVVSALQEKDYVVFTVGTGAEFLFQCFHVDERWVYLRMSSETVVNYKVDKTVGRMRKFVADSWSAIDGKFQHHFQE